MSDTLSIASYCGSMCAVLFSEIMLLLTCLLLLVKNNSRANTELFGCNEMKIINLPIKHNFFSSYKKVEVKLLRNHCKIVNI